MFVSFHDAWWVRLSVTSRILLPFFLTPSLPPLLTCRSRPLNDWHPFLLQSLHVANNRALGIVHFNRHRMCSDLLCLALHPTVFTNYMFSPSTPPVFSSNSSLTWLIAASNSHVRFPGGPACLNTYNYSYSLIILINIQIVQSSWEKKTKANVMEGF